MIGWYIHHQGRGHLTRAQTIARYLDEPVTALSSLPVAENHLFTQWIQLDRDDELDGSVAFDATAHGLLHWAPLRIDGLSQRMAAIATWIATHRPRLMVVDVSVEVAVLARLCGVPVIVMAGPGDRSDRAHQLSYGLAKRIIAPWPREIYDPAFLREHLDRTVFTGALSRFDGTVRPDGEHAADGVLVLSGAGGTTLSVADLAAAQQMTPGIRWTGAGIPGTGWLDDVWTSLVHASVVVAHAGQNALAEVAAARRPTVLIAQQRPFDEQHEIASALTRAGLAVSVPSWPEPSSWPALLDEATALGGAGWPRWNDGGGAQRAARAIAADR